MDNQQAVYQLKTLLRGAKNHLNGKDTDDIFQKDAKALRIAIDAIESSVKSEKIKIETFSYQESVERWSKATTAITKSVLDKYLAPMLVETILGKINVAIREEYPFTYKEDDKHESK